MTRAQTGRVGPSEASALLGVSMAVWAMFNDHPDIDYAGGNVFHISTAVGAMLAFGVFALLVLLMNRAKCDDLLSFFDFALGRFGGRLAAVVASAVLVYGAAQALNNFFVAIKLYIFQNTPGVFILAIFLVAAGVLCYLGFETITRVAKVFAGLLFVAAVAAMAANLFNMQPHRIAPAPGSGYMIALGGGRQSLAFMGALLIGLVFARAQHSLRFARQSGLRALIVAALLSTACILCMELAVPGEILSGAVKSVFRLGVLQQASFSPLDELYVFVWLMGGIVVAALSAYASGYCFGKGFGQKDIRPVSLGMCAAAVALIYLMNSDVPVLKQIDNFLVLNLWWLLLGALALVCVCAAARIRFAKGGERVAKAA